MSAVAPTATVPEIRIRAVNDAPFRPDGDFVLYWMTAFRRVRGNFALDRAADLAQVFGQPVLVLEPLRCGYPWAADRFHRFVLDGMEDNRRELDRAGLAYFPYVEPRPGAGKGLLAALAERACAVVGDDWPGFFHPRMLEAAASVPVACEVVDGCGLLPLRATDRPWPSAYAFRRMLQRTLPEHLATMPGDRPRRSSGEQAVIPRAVRDRWPPADGALLSGQIGLEALPLDHTVGTVPLQGGATAARRRLREFLRRLDRYPEERNQPEEEAASGLSPYLHFGHISTQEILQALARREGWTPDRLAERATGKRTGWWGMSSAAEAFLDELVTWREVGLNAAAHLPNYRRYDSLPEWAQQTLAEHAADPRPSSYGLSALEAGETHDPLWNAAQNQLRRHGVMHNYLRMLWGKKILEWSPSPERALEVMVELNNKYALDGRDPNSYSGIFWCLGRYDRPWAPERPIFGRIRYMSSANTARKFRVKNYIAEHGGEKGADVERGVST